MKTIEFDLISAGNMAGSLTSPTAILEDARAVAVHARYAGAPSGSLKIQASLDGTNWVDLGGAFTTAVSAAGETLYQIADAGYKYLRMTYTFTAGTGTLNARINIKSEK